MLYFGMQGGRRISGVLGWHSPAIRNFKHVNAH